MPPPPIQVVVQAPPVPPPAQAPVIPPPPVGQPQGRPQSQQFQPSHRRRRSSPDTRSPSSSTTGISQLDIVTFPTGMSRREDRDRDLSDIPEVPSIRSQSRASEAQPTPPSWVSDPPVDYTTRGDINQWRYSSSSHSPSNTSTALSPLENTYLSPSFQPRGRGTERISSSDYRRASSGSSNSYNFTIQPPSRPASRPQEPDVERQGFLSPNHTPRALTPEPPAVIAPSEIYVVPPPGFVAFQSPNTGHANLNGSGSNPPNGNIYSNWGTPSSGSPNAKPVPLRTPGAPSSGSRRTDTPPSHIPYHPHQPPRPIYAPTPPAHVRPLGGASEPPVIPPPFLHMAPRQPGGGGATPGPYHRSLPGGQPISTPRSGALRRIPSDSTISSSGSYSRPNQNSYDSPWVDRESPPDPATQRNTLVNAASTAGALPIPPPSFSRHRY
ncbi:hypothetical protein BDZ94DRAFT_1270072 [Collybia nuda]|uniref:Uncharacterized protein n=1 Tax=Collybia nuda TaxID=64659 RepID=A0A9P5XZT9_9AGAR|nr:hypothetical protein BDZ94DRAFT_1270072 [Collybia nuda]